MYCTEAELKFIFGHDHPFLYYLNNSELAERQTFPATPTQGIPQITSPPCGTHKHPGYIPCMPSKDMG